MTDNDLQASRRSTLKFVSGATVGATGFSTAATATDDDQSEESASDNSTDEFILRLEETPVGPSLSTDDAKLAAEQSQEPVVDSLRSLSAVTVERQFWITNAVLVSSDSAGTTQSELSALSGVREVHENFEVEPPEPEQEQHVVAQDHGQYTYGLQQINAPDVWDTFGTRGEGVSVAVLDTGIDPDHPDIEFNEDNWAFFDGQGEMVDAEPFDNNGHGTHVSGTVAGQQASGLDSQPHFGVAPDVELYNGKVLNNGGTFAQIIAGIEWAVDNGVDVINMSLGGPGYSDAYIDPIQNANEMGTMVVTSAGNSGLGNTGSPGNVYDSFSIGASDVNRDIAGFSSGELVNKSVWDAWWLIEDWPLNYYVPNVSAPGVNVLSAQPDGQYAEFNGTSMASPHTAGAVALMLSANPDLSLEEAEEYFETTARHGDGPDANPGPRYGEGIIDVMAAITAATDGNTVEGTVTAGGQPVPGVTVETDFGTDAETGEDGSFELYVGDGDWELTADGFGFQMTTESVSVSGGETATQDIALEPAVDVVPLQGQQRVMSLNETFDIEVQVANLEALTVSLTDDSAVSAENLRVVAGGTPVTLGETVEFDQPLSGPVSLTVASQSPSPGEFGLVHEFEGPGDTVTVETGPTEVMSDPDPATFEIVDWGQTEEVVMGETLNEFCVVENTGDYADTQSVSWWLGDPNGINVFPNEVTLEGGEQATVPFPISIPAAFTPPGTQIPHGWFTDDQLVEVLATFVGANYQFISVDAPSRVDRGETLEVSATVQNAGSIGGESNIQYLFDGVTVSTKTVSADPGGTDSVTFEFDTSRVVRGEYTHVLVGEFSEAGPLPISIGEAQSPPPIVGSQAPTDPDGDGYYEDITGDGEVGLDDVQALSMNLKSDAVQNNPQFFDFNEDGRVTVSDVQALFDELND